MHRPIRNIVLHSIRFITLTCVVGLSFGSPASASPNEALTISGVSGGLCVHLGCGDGSLAAQIAEQPRFIVQGLEADAATVAAARSALSAKKLYGQVSIDESTGTTLPYADNVVNLLLVDKAGPVTPAEMLRVLCPGGVLCMHEGGHWVKKAVKPRPEGMDEWPQWRHGPERNPVSKDRLVEVPRRIQWLSYQGKDGKEMITAGGRYYCLIEGTLRTRDAFNGLPLWSAQVDPKCRPAANASGVFVLMKTGLVQLDGATGETKHTYPDAGSPGTIILLDDKRDPEGILLASTATELKAIAVGTGKVIWEMKLMTPRGLCVGNGTVFVISGETKGSTAASVLALNAATGALRWERKDLAWASGCYRSDFGNGMVAFETGKFAIPRLFEPDKNAVNGVHFLAATDGRTLCDYLYDAAMRHDENSRAFFVGKRVFLHQKETQKQPTTLAVFDDITKSPTIVPTVYKRSMPLFCFPPVATERFFIYGELGFTDWNTFTNVNNPITRGACGRDTEGMIPANGMMYMFPKSCSCFSMLNGVAALAPAYAKPVVPTQELVKGPAFGTVKSVSAQAGDWPIYRGDVFRSGSNATTVAPSVKTRWTIPVETPAFKGPALDEWAQYPYATGPITPPVIAQGLVVVAQPHTHRLLAYAAETGKPAWSFIANGRIDSAPTLADGCCIFGTRTGWLYCLRASDGVLAWRLRVAPAELRIIHCGQVESPWPVAGSVLVNKGIAYLSAGLHPLADGGITAFAVDTATGRVIWSKPVSEMGYDQRGWHGRLGLEQDYNDLFVVDGDKLAMSRWIFDIATGQNSFQWHDSFYRLGKDGGFLARGTWSYGYPMIRPRLRRPLQVGHGAAVFGINKSANPADFKWPEGAGAPKRSLPKLFRRDFKPNEDFNRVWNEQENDTESRIGLYNAGNRVAENNTWIADYPGWVEAMALAGDHLFLCASDTKAKGKMALKSYAAADGKLLGEIPTPQPVWDGLAASGGRLYLSAMDGSLSCLAP